MIIKSGLMKEIMSNNASNKVYLYGAGKRLYEIYEEFGDNLRIKAIIDNDIQKQKEGVIKIGTMILPIISKDQFIKEADQHTCVILTMRHFHDAYRELESIQELDNVICYIYNLILAEEKDELLYPKEYRLPDDALKTKVFRIPKTIHYCWFGNSELPAEYRKYMESWRKYCPDYEIIRWDESNYDVSGNSYMRAAYRAKKWAYVTDYARVDIVNRYGGIYLDTDVELIKPLDILLQEKAFCGYESMGRVNFGLGYGSIKENPVLKELLQLYDGLTWDGGEKSCPEYQTEILKRHGLLMDNSFQRLDDITVFPAEFLSGKSEHTRRIRVTKNTFSIHHYTGSWFEADKDEQLYRKLRNLVYRE